MVNKEDKKKKKESNKKDSENYTGNNILFKNKISDGHSVLKNDKGVFFRW